MTEMLTHDHFHPLLEQIFTITIPELPESLALTLTQAQRLEAAASGGQRTPFSLLFHGPLTPLLPQRIYPLAHEQLGTQLIFIVPLGPDREHSVMRYEAIFT